jgi:hypothetical protein
MAMGYGPAERLLKPQCPRCVRHAAGDRCGDGVVTLDCHREVTDIVGMVAPSRTSPRPDAAARNQLAQYTPSSFSQHSRWRFGRNRKASYLNRIVGEVTPWQVSTIATLVSLEWAALVAESRHADMVAGREAREHRRLFMRLLADFEKSLTALPPKRALTASDWLRGKDDAA